MEVSIGLSTGHTGTVVPNTPQTLVELSEAKASNDCNQMG